MSSFASCTASFKTDSKSGVRWPISRMESPVFLKLIMASAASLKTALGMMLGPALKLCIIGQNLSGRAAIYDYKMKALYRQPSAIPAVPANNFSVFPFQIQFFIFFLFRKTKAVMIELVQRGLTCVYPGRIPEGSN